METIKLTVGREASYTRENVVFNGVKLCEINGEGDYLGNKRKVTAAVYLANLKGEDRLVIYFRCGNDYFLLKDLLEEEGYTWEFRCDNVIKQEGVAYKDESIQGLPEIPLVEDEEEDLTE